VLEVQRKLGPLMLGPFHLHPDLYWSEVVCIWWNSDWEFHAANSCSNRYLLPSVVVKMPRTTVFGNEREIQYRTVVAT
jgi:hypothetical protein